MPPLTDHTAICDEYLGFEAPGFRLRLTLTATTHEAYSLGSDLIRQQRDTVNEILGDAFSRVLQVLRESYTPPTRRDTDVNTVGAGLGQNP